MSHTNTRLELHPGLNVLIGPNNSGKSAVVLALQLLSTLPNREGDYMVRHGEKGCSVEVETAEGDTIIWERKGSAVRLFLNDEKLDRLVNNQDHNLDRLHHLLRMPEVSSEGSKDKFDVHFALQKAPIFLLDSESGAATFFASSSDASRLMRMQGLFREKVRSQKSEQRLELSRRTLLQTELNSLVPLASLEPALEKLEAQHADLNLSLEKAKQLQRAIEQLEQAQRAMSRFEFQATSLEKLQEPPALENVQPFEKLHQLLEQTLEAQTQFESEMKQLRPLSEPPIIEDVQPLEVSQGKLIVTQRLEAGLIHQCEVLKSLSDPPDLLETVKIELDVKELAQSHRRVLSAQKHQELLAHLQEVPELQAFDELALDAQMLVAEQERIATLQTAAKQNESEFEQWVSEHPNCPHCGSAIASVPNGGDHEH